MTSYSNSKNPAAKLMVKVPHPDSLVEVRVSPPESNFEVKVSPGEELIELLIRPGAGLIEVRIVPPGSQAASRLDSEFSNNFEDEKLVLDGALGDGLEIRSNPGDDEEEVVTGVSRREFAAMVEEEEGAEAKKLLDRLAEESPALPGYVLPDDVKEILESDEEIELPVLEADLPDDDDNEEAEAVPAPIEIFEELSVESPEEESPAGEAAAPPLAAGPEFEVSEAEMEEGSPELLTELEGEELPAPGLDLAGAADEAPEPEPEAGPPIDDVSIIIEDAEEPHEALEAEAGEDGGLELSSAEPAAEREPDYPYFETDLPEPAPAAEAEPLYSPETPTIVADECLPDELTEYAVEPEENPAEEAGPAEEAALFPGETLESVGTDEGEESAEALNPGAREALARLSAAASEEGASFEENPAPELNPDSTLMVEMYEDREPVPAPAVETRTPLSDEDMMDLGPMEEVDEELALGSIDLPDLGEVDLDQSRLSESMLGKSVVKAKPLVKVNPANTIVPE